MRALWVYIFVAAVMFTHTLTEGAADVGDRSDNAAKKFPASQFPATVIPSDQCADISSSTAGKHALRRIYSDIRKVVSGVAPLMYPYGECALGYCEENPVFSCNEVSQSGIYWLQASNGSSVRVYCKLQHLCSCSNANSSNPWMLVAFHNMSDTNQSCPFNLRLSEIEQRRFCSVKHKGCTSIFFDTFGVNYSKVCGRVMGIQFGEPNAFRPYFNNRELTLEDQYVDGATLTHGLTHVWTFAMAEDEVASDDEACPCTRSDVNYTGVVPPFIGDNYFCDTGTRTRSQEIYYWDDPLWDGAGCGATSTCCEWQNPPWFCRSLPWPTRDNLELRLCTDSPSDDELLLLETIEIYVQ